MLHFWFSFRVCIFFPQYGDGSWWKMLHLFLWYWLKPKAKLYIVTWLFLQVSVRSALLGALFSLGIFLSMFHNNWKIFGLYIMVLSAFHFSEFLVMAISNPSTLSVDSFILNHSPQYTLAALASWIEFLVELYFFPSEFYLIILTKGIVQTDKHEKLIKPIL